LFYWVQDFRGRLKNGDRELMRGGVPMTENSKDVQFSWVDVGEWVEQGLIAPAQARAIWRYVQTRSAMARRPEPGPEQPRGLNLITIAYYFGGFLILLAYTVFIGLQWGTLTFAGQSLILAATIGVLWAVGYLVRRAGFQTGGGLLIFAGTGIVPLLVYTALRTFGIQPDPGSYIYLDQSPEQDALFAMVIAGVSLATALVVLLWIRFPLLTLLGAFWSYCLVTIAASWFLHRSVWSWESDVRIAGVILGFGLIVLGIYLQPRERQRYSLWLYIVGHLVLLSHLSSLLLGRDAALGLLYLCIYLASVVASVWLQQRVFLVFGALGCYTYVTYLAFDVFSGSLGFALAMAAVGFVVILSAVGYQKYARPWLADQLAPRKQPSQLDA
jgi:hypothetical protein